MRRTPFSMYKTDLYKSLDISVIRDFLQHNTNFCIDNKILRRGKLLLYNITDYHIKFSIKSNKNILKVFEVPYPFLIYKDNSSVTFSYKLSDLCKGNDVNLNILDDVEVIGSNKFNDKRLTIINMDL